MFEWLNDYYILKRRIEHTEYQVEVNKSELKRWVEGDLQDVRLTKESLASNLETHIKKLETEYEYLIAQRKKLKEFIFKFDDLDSRILYKRYIEQKTLEEIAYELGYSYGHIKRCHASLVKLIKFVDEEA